MTPVAIGIVNAGPFVSKSRVGFVQALESVEPGANPHDAVEPEPVNPLDVTRKLNPAPPLTFCTESDQKAVG